MLTVVVTDGGEVRIKLTTGNFDMTIHGSIALITGSARRIGRAIALELARRGARVAVHYRTSEAEARATLQQIEKAGSAGAVFCADLRDIRAIEQLFGEVKDRFGTVDILVNNASVFAQASAVETTSEIWDEQFLANVRAPFFAAQRAALLMRASGRGKIINIADTAGEVIWPGYFAYSISKAALLAVTRGLAKVYAPQIQVNAVSPGPVLFPEFYSEEQKRAAIERTLLKRMGSVDDVVGAVIFLIENDYITGEVIHVDGGRHVV